MAEFDWEYGTFMGENSGFVAGFAGDWLAYDVLRDVPTLGKVFTPVPGLGALGAGTFNKRWLLDPKYSGYASQALGMAPEKFAKRATARGAFAGKSVIGNLYERVMGTGSRFFDVGWGTAEYGEARLASRMGWHSLNPLNWGAMKSAIGGKGLAYGALQGGANLVGTAMALTMSAGAIGFNLASAATEAYTSYAISRGEREIGNVARVDMAPAFYDTRGAATMRQAAVQEIHNTQLNLRSAFGQEATSLHR